MQADTPQLHTLKTDHWAIYLHSRVVHVLHMYHGIYDKKIQIVDGDNGKSNPFSNMFSKSRLHT